MLRCSVVNVAQVLRSLENRTQWYFYIVKWKYLYYIPIYSFIICFFLTAYNIVLQ